MIVIVGAWYFFSSSREGEKRDESHSTRVNISENVVQRSASSEAPFNPLQTDGISSDSPRSAADAYVESLKGQGIVFASQYRTGMQYPNLFPPTVEVIYVLDYKTADGSRVVGPYTITTKRSAEGWKAVGSSPGNRTDLNTNPVRGTDGTWRNSPLEEYIGEAVNRANRR